MKTRMPNGVAFPPRSPGNVQLSQRREVGSSMSRRTTPPFRAGHVGSLLRPRRLLQAGEDFAAGRIPANELRAIEDQEIPGAIRMQEEVGLQQPPRPQQAA